MADLLIPFLFFVLLFVIILQAIERHVFGEQMQKEISKLVAAVMSKDIHEYTTAIRVEKEPLKGFAQPDEVDLTNATDDEFSKFIKTQTE